MPESLVLVRHAMPVVDAGTPSQRWQLGEAGRTAARALRSRLPRHGHYVSSHEPKALQTVQQLTDQEVLTDDGFAEVRRPSAWTDDYRSQARAYVDGRQHPGWEPHGEVAQRFDEAIRRHLTAADGKALIVGTHGLAPTIWLASRIPLASPGEFWAALDFPDLVRVDLQRRTAAKNDDPRRGETGVA
jgi:broad specificity phosphatase PhoE